MPPAASLAPRVGAGRDQGVHLVPLPLVDDRAERDLAGRRVAHREVRRLIRHGRHVVVVHGLVHQVPAGRHADLALVQERPPGARRRGPRHVNVVEDDQRRVAAELQVHPLEVAGGEFADPAAGGGGAGERDDPDERVSDHGLPGVHAAGQHVQQPVGQARLLEDPGQHDAAADGGARVRLEHHRVAQRQRRRDRTDPQDLREVEWRDHADHPGRDTLGEAEPRLLARQQIAVGAGRQRGRLVDLAEGDVGLELGRGYDLAALPDDPLLDLRGVGLPDGRGPAQERGSFGVRDGGPGRLRGRGQPCRARHVGGAGDPGPAELGPGRGLDNGGVAAFRCHPAAEYTRPARSRL